MLVGENRFLTVFMPAYGALVFRVLHRVNKNYDVFNYGPIPLKTNMSLSSLDGGSVYPSSDGCIPARSYNENGLTFPLQGAFDPTDMWYLSEDHRDRVFHVITEVSPSILKIDLEIPKGVKQSRFQKDKLIGGVRADFGFSRGRIETVHIPRIHYGYRFGNDTNIEWRTFVRFRYGEYVVEIPDDPDLIFDILSGRVASHWVTLPVNSRDDTITAALNAVYGFTGFRLFPVNKRSDAVNEYRVNLSMIRR
ncbi:MAG: hypothetical protein QXZ17_01940 [Nitrososphaerota archaeon]